MIRDSGRIRNYLWRRKLVIETTFAINALEPWEKLIFCTHNLFHSSFLSFIIARVEQSQCYPSWLFSCLEAYAAYFLLSFSSYNNAHRITYGGMMQTTAF